MAKYDYLKVMKELKLQMDEIRREAREGMSDNQKKKFNELEQTYNNFKQK